MEIMAALEEAMEPYIHYGEALDAVANFFADAIVMSLGADGAAQYIEALASTIPMRAARYTSEGTG
jgi:hypothetical protein